MMRLSRAGSTIVAIAVLALAGVLLVAAADAAKKTRSKITLTNKCGGKPCGYHGRVKSKVKACRVNRKVVIKAQYKPSSTHPKGYTTVIIRTKTDKKGRYGVSQVGLFATGYRVFATANKRRVKHGGKRYVCKAARSKYLHFGY